MLAFSARELCIVFDVPPVDFARRVPQARAPGDPAVLNASRGGPSGDDGPQHPRGEACSRRVSASKHATKQRPLDDAGRIEPGECAPVGAAWVLAAMADCASSLASADNVPPASPVKVRAVVDTVCAPVR